MDARGILYVTSKCGIQADVPLCYYSTCNAVSRELVNTIPNEFQSNEHWHVH